MIEVSHLSKSYGIRPAVQDLSFTVPDGQIYGLLGPNGAGKSTIMNILTGYLAPTQGEVKVAGFRLPEQAQQAKACVGYLPEQPPLYPEMTVQEYLDFVAELKGVKRAQRKQQVLAAALLKPKAAKSTAGRPRTKKSKAGESRIPAAPEKNQPGAVC